jgi:hypothetical protein
MGAYEDVSGVWMLSLSSSQGVATGDGVDYRTKTILERDLRAPSAGQGIEAIYWWRAVSIECVKLVHQAYFSTLCLSHPVQGLERSAIR